MNYYICVVNDSSVSLSYATAGEETLCSMISEDGNNLCDLADGDYLLVYKDYPISKFTMSLVAKGNNRFVKEVEVANGVKIDCFSDELKQKIHARNGLIVEISKQVYNEIFFAMIASLSGSKEKLIKLPSKKSYLQQIFYGAPGTGKSHTINEETVGEDVIRTTFHPDTDYSTFVGAYKPTTIEETVMTVIGTKAVPVENADGTLRMESKIVYEFVAQAFLQAYVEAWRKYAQAEGEPKKQFLVIEEINRGNCAQIFGDLFQLLDRNDSGFSDYPILADADMKRQLQKAFKGLELTNKEALNNLYQGRNVADEVMKGDILLLPNNLYIWATMNTSDQSLFPIDSAFKRRWDWAYMPISDAHKDWTIEVEGVQYDWWKFLTLINAKISSMTSSEDKKLGYFFCKAEDNVISAQKFVGKVIFYLWNDVFKDYEFGDAIFNDEDGSKLSFDKFYTEEGRNSKVVTEKVALFLQNLGLQPLSADSELGAEEPSEIDNA